MASLAKHTKTLLDLMPVGKAMENKYDIDTNIYKFWKAVAMYYVLVEQNYNELISELGITTTEYLIERWEKEFGIPDNNFEIATTLEERRNNILLKKGGLNLLNIEEFRELALRLGFSVTIETATSLRYPPYDVPFYPLGEPDVYFLVVITGDFSSQNIQALVDFFETLLPINVGTLLINTGP